MTHDCDVLIIGAGPVGSTLALELALHQVSFRIIDKVPVRSDKSRALVVQNRTLELLRRHGAVEELIPRGRSLRGFAYYIHKNNTARMVFDGREITETEFPIPLNVSQAETEQFLDNCLAGYGISIERPVTATNITQETNGITTILEMPGGKLETVHSKYVVGCDGAHSMVRQSAKNIIFQGGTYPQTFLLCDVRIRDSNLSRDHILLHFGPTGVLAMFSVNQDTIRLVAAGEDPLFDRTSGDLTIENFQSIFDKFTPPGAGILENATWMTPFRLHYRCANSYRDGRLFIAGDAAHIHSPSGGQGMNAGIQDAINLGWKLALVLQNKVNGDPDVFLDTYNAERQPVGRDLLSTTDRLFTFMSNTNPFVVAIRNFVVGYIFPWLTSRLWWRKRVLQIISEFGVSYRDRSPIVGTATSFKGTIRGGDRLPDGKLKGLAGDETSLHRLCVGSPHHLLLFSGGSAAEKELVDIGDRVQKAMKSEVQVHFISKQQGDAAHIGPWYMDSEGKRHSQFGFSGPGYVLVRPDGYVAHIGLLSHVDQLVSFLEG